MSQVKGQPGKTTAWRVRWPHFLSRFFTWMLYHLRGNSVPLGYVRGNKPVNTGSYWPISVRVDQMSSEPHTGKNPGREEQLPFHIYNRNGFEMRMFLFPWLQAFAGFFSSVLFSYWSTLHCLRPEGPAVEYLVVPKRDGWDNLLYINVLFQIGIGSGHPLLPYFPSAPT